MKIKIIDFGYEKEPNRAHYNDAGADVFSLDNYVINNNETIKVPLGFGLEIPDGYVGFIFPKSGLSSKGLTSELAPIDSGYRGEIHAIMTNNSHKIINIDKGQKIGQLVILPLVIPEYTSESIFNEFSGRDTGAFGSTGI